ncbi:MAG: DUF494 family protein [Candidatus Hydrogenedentes bacterium]|nr:DUF494 family protein [Candidatus Hydrogenedentota bacterium]
MKPSLTKLVDVILRKIQETPEAPPSESGLRTWLAHQGYKQRDIDAAFKLVRPRLPGRPSVERQRPATLRNLSVYEDYKLTPEARDALARLELYGLIDGYEREMILDRLGQFEAEVGLEELDYLLSWLVCSGRDVESQHTIYSVLEGRKPNLH